MKSYTVNKIPSALSFKEVNWGSANHLDDFIYPWEDQESLGLGFKAVWDDKHLYFRFDVLEENVLVYEKDNNKLEVANSDRIEIFIRQDSKMVPYYCLEIDPKGRVLDYKATPNRNFKMDWEWPKEHLFVEAQKNQNGYVVQIRISLDSLKDFGLIKNNVLEIGLYRGKCNSIFNDSIDLSWISWVNPKTELPDFHIESSFGKFILNSNLN